MTIITLNLKQPTICFANSDLLRNKSQIPTSKFVTFTPKITQKSNLWIQPKQPLHLNNVKGLSFDDGLIKVRKSVIKCKAYEADKSQPSEVPGDAAKRVKIGIYFATWWALNVVFNIYNKKVLNVFPYPWLTSTLSLAMGSLIMLVSWATKIAEAPNTDFDFWKALFPVAVAHSIGHVAATVSMSKVAVSFTHIIKSAEPAFSVLVSRFLLGESFSAGVYWSLLPIIGGCGLAAVTELNFNMAVFWHKFGSCFIYFNELASQLIGL